MNSRIWLVFIAVTVSSGLACSKGPDRSAEPTSPEPPAPMASKAPAMITGEKLADTEWYTVVAKPAPARAGEDAVVKLAIQPKPGWKINQEFPTKLTVAGGDGVVLGKPQLAKSDAVYFGDKIAIFDVAYKANSAGTKDFTGQLKFAVCTDATCDPKKTELAWAVDVK